MTKHSITSQPERLSPIWNLFLLPTDLFISNCAINDCLKPKGKAVCILNGGWISSPTTLNMKVYLKPKFKEIFDLLSDSPKH